jgi:hypothetical protein
MDYFDWAFGIVPAEYPASRPAPSPMPAPSYEIPWWGDTINRAIERAAQVATVHSAGYPQIPTFPTAPQPMPLPYPVQQQQQPSGAGIQLSTNTLMLLVGGFLLFTLGQRRGR